jgi:hypothetical protein
MTASGSLIVPKLETVMDAVKTVYSYLSARMASTRLARMAGI